MKLLWQVFWFWRKRINLVLLLNCEEREKKISSKISGQLCANRFITYIDCCVLRNVAVVRIAHVCLCVCACVCARARAWHVCPVQTTAVQFCLVCRVVVVARRTYFGDTVYWNVKRGMDYYVFYTLETRIFISTRSTPPAEKDMHIYAPCAETLFSFTRGQIDSRYIRKISGLVITM